MAKYKNAPQLIEGMKKRLTIDAIGNAKKAVTEGTILVEKTAKSSIQKGGTGRIYEKYNPRRTHQASSPRNPPATDTGFLVSNITSKVKVNADGSVTGQIISAAPYSAALEFGTKDMLKNGGARPFMQPALESNKANIRRIFKKHGVVS